MSGLMYAVCMWFKVERQHLEKNKIIIIVKESSQYIDTNNNYYYLANTTMCTKMKKP